MTAPDPLSQERIIAFLRKAEIDPPPHIEPLLSLPKLAFAPSGSDLVAARALLVEQRVAAPDYRQPESKKRHFLSRNDRRKKQADNDTWLFTHHEVAKAFDALLAREPLAPVTLAQAILSHAASTTTDELWRHLHDQKLEKRMNRYFFARSSSSETIPEMTWLDWTTENGPSDYVRLLCAQGVPQTDLNRSLHLALSKNLIEATTILLRAGAVIESYETVIKEQIRLRNADMVALLISAPNKLSADAWRVCIEPELMQKGPPLILAKCLSHRPDIVDAALLYISLSARNVAATAVILAYAKSNTDFVKKRQLYFETLVISYTDNKTRLQFFSLFAMMNLLADLPILQRELLRDVKARQLELVQILVNARVSVDIEPNNAVKFAVSNLDLEMLELFRNAVFSSPVSPLLDLLPITASQPEILKIIDILGHRGLKGNPLHAQLIRAVRRRHTEVVTALLSHGASIEYQQASAVRIALEKVDFPTLDILLEQECSRKILSLMIPVAMSLSARSARMKAVACLTQKGVLPQELGVPLQTLVAEGGAVDYELIRLLLRHKAPIDDIRDSNKNAVLVATQRGLAPLLELLCASEPEEDTLSNALSSAFDAVRLYDREIAFQMLEILLKSGARGELLDQTLLTAVSEDNVLDIIKLLLDAGADANYQSGASFAVALKQSNFELVQCLCTTCPPTPATTKSVLHLATAPSYFDLNTLYLLLGTTTSGLKPVLDAYWSSGQLEGSSNIGKIIRCFLDHGMDVNLKDGALLCFAIQQWDFELVYMLCSGSLNTKSLTTAFREACSVSDSDVRHHFMESLLQEAQETEIGQTAQLTQEIHHALEGDTGTFQMLLEQNANINCEDGLVVQMAAAAGSKEILAALLAFQPDKHTIRCACIATAASSVIGLNEQGDILKRLLDSNRNLSAEDMSKILAESVTTFPEYTLLPELLLTQGVLVDVYLLKMALLTASQTLFTLLADRMWNSDTLLQLFEFSHNQSLAWARRYWISKYFLGRGMAKNDISEALLRSFTRQGSVDPSLSKLLLDNGAALDYKSGAVINSALDLNSFEIVDMLSQYILHDSLANHLFCLASTNTHLSKETRYMIYHRCCAWNIEVSSVHLALVENLLSKSADGDIVALLLQHGADPNQDSARCFLTASKHGLKDEFRALCRYGKPNLNVVVQSLMDHFAKEGQVVRWFRICLEECLGSIRICKDDLLFQCMRKFPNGDTLLTLLLDRGAPPATQVIMSLRPGWQLEVCSTLLWAVCSSTPRIGNTPILALISRGGKKVLPAYSAPSSNLTAAFACVLDSTRTNVLRALLDLDLEGVMGHTMLESKFTQLAAYPETVSMDPDSINSTHEIDLRTACIFTGNFKAFKLLRFMNKPNDGTIIAAVVLALPKFIQWLLANGHDPNYCSEDSRMLIPLAMVCSAQPMASCKIANAEADFVTRRKDAMKILADVTDLSWRYRGKTVLHFAFDQGPEVTQAMVDALKLHQDKDRDEKYLYTDREGINYSPDEYIRHLMTDLNEQQKDELVNIIQACDTTSRITRMWSLGSGVNSPWGIWECRNV